MDGEIGEFKREMVTRIGFSPLGLISLGKSGMDKLFTGTNRLKVK